MGRLLSRSPAAVARVVVNGISARDSTWGSARVSLPLLLGGRLMMQLAKTSGIGDCGFEARAGPPRDSDILVALFRRSLYEMVQSHLAFIEEKDKALLAKRHTALCPFFM